MGFCEKCDLLLGKLNKTFGYDSNLVSPNVASIWRFRGMLCVISLEAHVKSIQGVIGTSERVTLWTRKL